MVFEDAGYLFTLPFAVAVLFASHSPLMVLSVIALAFAVDGVETLIRVKVNARSQSVISTFRDRLRKEPLSLDSADFAVILTAYRNPDEVKRSVSCLLKTGIPKDRIVVADDFSDDQYQTAKAAAKFGVKVVSVGRNTAKVGVINIVLDMVDTKYVVLLDSDSVLLTDYNGLRRAIMEMELQGLDAMAGQVRPCGPAEDRFDSELAAVHTKRSLLELQSLEYDQAMRLGRSPMYILDRNYKVRYAEVTSVSGAFGIFRRTSLKQIITRFKVREENFSGEDIERTFKILALNGRVGYSNDLVTLTSAPVDVVSHFKQRVQWAAGLFRCFISRFGTQICKRRLAGVTYLVYAIRDVLLHPLKLLSMFFLLLNPTDFLLIMAFYILLNFLVVWKVNGSKSSMKIRLLLPFYRLYMSIFPTTVGYLKALVHGVKIYMQGNRGIRPIEIVRTWN